MNWKNLRDEFPKENTYVWVFDPLLGPKYHRNMTIAKWSGGFCCFDCDIEPVLDEKTNSYHFKASMCKHAKRTWSCFYFQNQVHPTHWAELPATPYLKSFLKGKPKPEKYIEVKE